MILPSRRWLAGAALLAIAAPLGLLGAAGARLWLFADLLWILALVIDAIRVSRVDWAGLVLVREGPTALSIGRPLPIRYRWQFGSGTLSLWIRESPPNIVRSAESDDRIVKLSAGRDTVEERTLVPERRGVASSWRFDLRLAGPWGFVWRQRRLELSWQTTVYPRLRDADLKELPSQSRVRREAGLRAARRLGEGRVFESLREWVPGDDRRIIDWKATARRGKLIARQYEDERRQRVIIALDAGRMLTAETDGRPRLEYAVEAAAQLVHHVASLDDDVGLLVFSDRIDHYLPPQRGKRSLRGVLDVLARVEGRLVEPNYPAAFAYLAARTRKRALTVVFTDVIDRFASEALVAQLGGLRPRHLPIAVTLRDTVLERLSTARPSTVAGAFERAAADELLRVREDALAAMRTQGVIVVDARPELAARAVVERYVQLKRRALI